MVSTRNEERGTREHLTSQLWGIKGAALSHCLVGFAYERVVRHVGLKGLGGNLCTGNVLVCINTR